MVITYSITSSSHNSIVFLLSVTFILQYYYKRFKQGSQYLFSNLLKIFSAQMFARDPIRAHMFVLVRSGRSGPARTYVRFVRIKNKPFGLFISFNFQIFCCESYIFKCFNCYLYKSICIFIDLFSMIALFYQIIEMVVAIFIIFKSFNS